MGSKMEDEAKTRAQLIDEMREMRSRIARYEKAEEGSARSRERLRKRKEEFLATTDVMTAKIWYIDREGRVRRVNTSAAQGLGLPVHAIVGKPLCELITPDDLSRFSNENEEVIRSGKPKLNVTERLTLPNGAIVWAQTDRIPYYDEAGEIAGVAVFSIDITEHKRAEEALYISRLQLSEAMDLARIVYWEHDPASNTYTFNDPFYTFYGTTAVQEGGYRMSGEEYATRFIHPEDRSLYYRSVERAGGKGREFSHDLEHRVVRRDGQVRHILARVRGIKDAEGRVIRRYGANQDVTERKEAGEALRRSEEKYRDIFERASEGIFQSTREGRFITVNPAYARMLGYDSPEELMTNVVDIGKQLYANPEDRDVSRRLSENPGALVTSENQFVRKDGRKIWVSVHARAVRDDEGRVLCFEGTMVDITEHKEAEQERATLQSRLRQSQKMEAIGTLAGGVAHDFNNILTALIGYGTLLQMKMEQSDPLRLYVDQIMSASQKAANLTHSLLAFSRQQPITLTPINVNTVVKGTEKLLRRLLTEDIILKTVTRAEEHTVMADITQIDQILLNLATNARDAMPNGGTLVIETELTTLDDSFSRTHGFGEPGKYLHLSVSDTGTGMDERTKEKIFLPFFTTKEVGKGTGLGLATVYGIVKQHDGYVTVASELHKGTTFHLYFPTRRAHPREEEPSPNRIVGGTETILVAEDNDEVRRLMTEMLVDSGYSVIEAHDGADAIENARREVDLLILDSVMPTKNGREAYDAIKELHPSIRVIFTSGYTRDIILDKGIEHGRYDFLAKPLQRNKLLEKVREVLDR